MPLYEFQCECGEYLERIFPSFQNAATQFPCEVCGSVMKRMISSPAFKLGWVPTVIDNGRAWEGTALEDADMTNKLTYKSKGLFIDQAKKTQVGGKSTRPTRGVGALGV